MVFVSISTISIAKSHRVNAIVSSLIYKWHVLPTVGTSAIMTRRREFATLYCFRSVQKDSRSIRFVKHYLKSVSLNTKLIRSLVSSLIVMFGPLSPYEPPMSILMYNVCNVCVSSLTSRRRYWDKWYTDSHYEVSLNKNGHAFNQPMKCKYFFWYLVPLVRYKPAYIASNSIDDRGNCLIFGKWIEKMRMFWFQWFKWCR